MKIFHYSPENGEFVGEGIADPNPLEEGRWLIPAFATATEPPAVNGNEVAQFDGNAWRTVVDLRGTEYWLDGESHIITEIGQNVPSGGQLSKPEPTLSEQRSAAVLDKETFCTQLLELDILSPEEAAAAARGEWPATFASVTAGMSVKDAGKAQIKWAAALSIHYNHPLLQGLAMAYANGDPDGASAVLDLIFEIS